MSTRDYGYMMDSEHARHLDHAAQDEHFGAAFPSLDEIREPWKKEMDKVLKSRQQGYNDYRHHYLPDQRLRRAHPHEYIHRSNKYWRTDAPEVYAEHSDDGVYAHDEFGGSQVSSSIGSARSFLSRASSKKPTNNNGSDQSYKLAAAPSISSYATANEVIEAANSNISNKIHFAEDSEKRSGTPRTVAQAPRRSWFKFARVQKKRKSAYTSMEDDDDDAAAQAYIDRYKLNLKAMPKHYTSEQRRRARDRKKEFKEKDARKKLMETFDKTLKEVASSQDWKHEMRQLNDPFFRRSDKDHFNDMPKFSSRREFVSWMDQWAETLAPAMKHPPATNGSIEDPIREIAKLYQLKNPDLINDDLVKWVVHRTKFLCKGISLGGANGDQFDRYEDMQRYSLAVKARAGRLRCLDKIVHSLPGYSTLSSPKSLGRATFYATPL